MQAVRPCEALRKVRESRGLNQRELAERAKVSQSTVTRAERGVSPIPEAVYDVLGLRDEEQLLAAACVLPTAAPSDPAPLTPDLSLYADERGKANVVAWEAAGGSPSLASARLGGSPTKQAISASVAVARRRKAEALAKQAISVMFPGVSKKK